MKKIQGFTLIETMVSMIIVSILGAMILPWYRGYIQKARFAEWIAMADAIKKSAILTMNNIHSSDSYVDGVGSGGEIIAKIESFNESVTVDYDLKQIEIKRLVRLKHTSAEGVSEIMCNINVTKSINSQLITRDAKYQNISPVFESQLTGEHSKCNRLEQIFWPLTFDGVQLKNVENQGGAIMKLIMQKTNSASRKTITVYIDPGYNKTGNGVGYDVSGYTNKNPPSPDYYLTGFQVLQGSSYGNSADQYTWSLSGTSDCKRFNGFNLC